MSRAKNSFQKGRKILDLREVVSNRDTYCSNDRAYKGGHFGGRNAPRIPWNHVFILCWHNTLHLVVDGRTLAIAAMPAEDPLLISGEFFGKIFR